MTLIAGRYQPIDTPPGGPPRARDLQTAQTVLLREVALPPGAERLVERAHAARGICHPSLVTLFDVVRASEDRLLLAYEFVPSQTLAQAAGGYPFTVRRAVEVVVEVADALAELHGHGVAHGGVSMSTVLLTMKGKAKLDRVADPTITDAMRSLADDLVALGALLRGLAAPSRGGAGAEAVQVLIDRAQTGRFESAAVFAAMLRRIDPVRR